MKTKRLFRWALAAALVTCLPLCTTSCMNHAAVEDEDKPYVSDEETILPVNMPAYVSAISEADYSKTVNALFPMRGSMDQAQIAVVTPSEIGTYNGQLYDLYQRGGLIVIARPDGSNYKTSYRKWITLMSLPLPSTRIRDTIVSMTTSMRRVSRKTSRTTSSSSTVLANG